MTTIKALDCILQRQWLIASPEALEAQHAPGLLNGLVYPASLYKKDSDLYALARDAGEKRLLVLNRAGTPGPDFSGTLARNSDCVCKSCPLTPANAAALRHVFPWTAPVSLAARKTTFGCGDRLGRATPGHLRAVRQFQVAPVLAQQSIRELTLTRRTFQNVLDDVTFLVFQCGYTLGYGADADHLKTLEHIRAALDAGMTMITLDLSEVMRPEAALFTPAQTDAEFARLPGETTAAIRSQYAGRQFRLAAAAGQTAVAFAQGDAEKCGVMYTPALDFARQVYEVLVAQRGAGHFDLEISIDETTTPTLPHHHFFIIRELIRRGVKVVSLAPRFIGEFQKGIDYAGDLREFTRQFTVHTIIAQTHGDYKISIHSGSDKFSIFPVVGRISGGRFHEKTAGTSWLEAVRLVATQAPSLYRKMHAVALERLPDAKKLYHITPALESIPPLASLKDEALSALMNLDAARQVLHVAYGFILEKPALREELFQVLDQFEDEHFQMLERHFTRHMELLQIPRG